MSVSGVMYLSGNCDVKRVCVDGSSAILGSLPPIEWRRQATSLYEATATSASNDDSFSHDSSYGKINKVCVFFLSREYQL